MYAGRKTGAANPSARSWKAAFDDDDAGDHAAATASPPQVERPFTEQRERGVVEAKDRTGCSDSRSRSRSRSRSPDHDIERDRGTSRPFASTSKRRRRSPSRSWSRSCSRSRSRSPDKELEPRSGSGMDSVSDAPRPFIAASSFDGPHPGFVFKLGTSGLGYYADLGSERAALASEISAFNAALRESTAGGSGPPAGMLAEGEVGSDADTPTLDPDAPIIAALASHRRGIAEAEEATAALEATAARGYGRGLARGRVSHEAQRIEVRLTDQLLQLTTMRDDCETAAGRAAVKMEMERLQALGRALLPLSGGNAR